ncbi:MAG: protein-disulfide reductase DsbD domain-containing protein [Myxococcota bacterium]
MSYKAFPTNRSIIASVALSLVVLSTLASAQSGAPKVTLRGLLESDGGQPGHTLYAAFEVSLPKGYHVNSNRPLEEFLKPTQLLLVTSDGMTVKEIVYPEASLFRTRFSEHALSVYENRFLIGVAIDIDENLQPGSRHIGATLRYQACTERVCFPPTQRQAELRVSVVSERPLLAPRHAAVFDSIQFSGRE